MNIKITYPQVSKKKQTLRKIINILKILSIIAVIACPIVNIATGGKAWSLVVIMSIYILWTMLLSPDLVEYNRISQFVKLITLTSILLVIIDVFLASGWVIKVDGILRFSGLIIAGVLFFTDLDRQKHNMLPLLFLIFLAIVTSILELCLYHGNGKWIAIVMGSVALALLIAIIIVLGNYLIKEIKKRFHTI